MIGSTRQLRVFAHAEPTDLRKGYDGLSAIVQQSMRRDPLSGDVFLFVSRNRQRAKALLWDGTGLCIYAKRLESGRFAAPRECESNGRLQMTMSELSLFLEGSKLVGRMPLSPLAFDRGVSEMWECTLRDERAV